MSTVRDLIKSSMRLIQAIATGETPTADEQSDAFNSLNRMLDRWSNEGLLIYATVREEFTLTSGDGSYTLGTGGNFNTSRPVKIESAKIEIQSSTPTYERPVRLINTDEWAAIFQKDTQGTPTRMYLEGTFSLETVNLWPVPDAANKLVLYSLKPITSFASVSTDVSFPPGYEDALVYNLALRLAPEFGKQPDPAIVIEATEAKAIIMRSNIKPQFLGCDPGVLSRSQRFNIITGDYQ